MIAVYSLWNMGGEDHCAGFNSIDDLMCMMKLSMLQSRIFFDRIIFVTDSIGAARATVYELPCDEIRIEFDHLGWDSHLWAMPKLLALSSVYEPDMMHIDNDFIWWTDPAVFWGDADMLFQNVEPFSQYEHYTSTLRYLREHYPDIYRYTDKTNYGYNCGVIGLRGPTVVDHLLRRALALCEAPGLVINCTVVYNLNFILEQAFIASLSVEMKSKVNMIMQPIDPGSKDITHLWGGAKRKSGHMTALRYKLETTCRYFKSKQPSNHQNQML